MRSNFGVYFLQEKQAHHLPRLREKIVTPDGAVRLFDLIEVKDERMKLAFFAALGNTVVAENIEQVGLYFENVPTAMFSLMFKLS